MTTSILGIGWVTREGCGGIRSGRSNAFESGEGPDSLYRNGIFSHAFKNFGRLDALSRMTAYAVALALRDAGIAYAAGRKKNIGLIGTGREGSLRTDIDFFRDYIRSGRTLSRGNLFIYTLPSSALGEAAIHFGFLGPLLYAVNEAHSILPVVNMAAGMIRNSEAAMMLAGRAEEEEAIFLVLGKESDGQGNALCSLDQARGILEASPAVRRIAEEFSKMPLNSL